MTLEASPVLMPEPVSSRDDPRRLRRALDSEALAAALAQAWQPGGRGGITIEQLSVERVHPARDGAFNLEIAVQATHPSGRISRRFHAELPAGDARSSFERAVVRLGDAKRNQLAERDIGDRLLLLEGAGLVLRDFGLDERIPRLGVIESLDAPLGAAPGRRLPTPPFEVALLAHRYGKRAVLRASGAGGESCILKLYKRKSDRSRRVARLMGDIGAAAAARAHALCLPAILGELPDGSGHAMEDIKGAALDAVHPKRALDGYRSAGRALAGLHQTGLASEDHHTVEDEIALVGRWVELVAATFPELARPFRTARATVSRELDAAGDYEPALIHRDFHEKQVLLQGDGVVLIDFDTVAHGNPAQDTGNFLAHLDLRELQHGDAMAPASAAFLMGYAQAGAHCSKDQVRAHRRATLLRLACLHALTSHRRTLAMALLDRIPKP